MLRQSFIAFFLSLLFCNLNIETKACKCAPVYFTADSEYADLIFQGMVVDKKDSLSIGKVFYTFKISKTWKGQSDQIITIKTNYGGPACGAFFDVYKEYVVFTTNLETSKCRRNSEASICSDISKLNYKYLSSYRHAIATDTSPILSKPESDYFNNILKNSHDIFGLPENFNFANIKIAFFDNNKIISKKEYFERYGGKDVSMSFQKISDRKMKERGDYYGVFFMHRKMALTKKKENY